MGCDPVSGTVFCFGLGYTTARLAIVLRDHDTPVAGTKTRLDGPEAQALVRAGVDVVAYGGGAIDRAARAVLAAATHVVVSIPPDLEGCPAARAFPVERAAMPNLCWIGYLSTIGVYGDAQGAWIDESRPVAPTSERALRRVVAEGQWREVAERLGVRCELFRLPGIYGPGRSMIETLRAGAAKRVVKPGQVFNRIHVDDIVATLLAAIARPTDTTPAFDVFNVVDDEPAPPQDVVTYAAELLGVAPPAEVPFSAAEMSPMAASFYAENKRVRNARIKDVLGVTLRFPTYREGLLAILGGAD
jgi:dTDP-4-dehydrorhamnose reductase